MTQQSARRKLCSMSRAARARPGLRQLPNLLSSLRIAAAPLLVLLAATGRETAFAWVLIPALLTDAADGAIARMLRLESRTGALLDSLGDNLLMVAAMFGVWMLHREVFLLHPFWVSAAAGLWMMESLLAFWRYGRFSSFHTYASKIAANLLGLFAVVLFVFGLQPWLLKLACGASVLASVEELVLLARLPEWRANVRGLWWLGRNGRGGG
jgi:CDP-diacylglycerol--glycerol-3-phosphate 3-phosphatidyltransferase